MFPQLRNKFYGFSTLRMGKKTLVFLLCVLFAGGTFLSSDPALLGKEKKNMNIVDKIYLAKQNANVVDNFGLGVKKAQAALDENELEYAVQVGPITGSAIANYVYAVFFNPTGSGRTAVLKRIAVIANATTTGNWVNLSVRRITTSTAGTQISASDIPTKNSSSSAPVLQVRHTSTSVAFAGTVDSRILGQPLAGTAGAIYSRRDITFASSSEKLILQPGEGIALYQEAAGSINNQIRMLVEWEEVTSAPTAQNEFLFAYPRVELPATATTTYNTFYNPSTSGKSAVIKRIWFGAETCDAVANYAGFLSLQRITTSTGATLVASSSIPKKNTSGATTTMQMRYATAVPGVIVATSGTADARIAHVAVCGAANEPQGWMQLDFDQDEEQLIIQQGEGFALRYETATSLGDVDQIVRMIVEWQEVVSASTPASQGQYIWGSARIGSASATSTSFYTFFNPTGSGKTAVLKRLVIRNNASSTAAASSTFTFRRISTSTGGLLIAATDLPKKHTGSASASMQVRWCGANCASALTVTYLGNTSSGLLSVNGPGAVGQVVGQRELVFSTSTEDLVLQEGEGIGLYVNNVPSSINHQIKVLFEWDEEATAPPSQGEYLLDVGPINGSTATSYNYATFFNPATSTKTAVIKRVSLRVDAVTTALLIPMQLRRISTSTAGTQILAGNIPKKHTGTADSFMIIRHTGVTATYQGNTSSSLFLSVQTPSAVGSAVAPAITGYREYLFQNDEKIILQPGEGVGLYHDSTAGDVDFRVKCLFEWQEVATSSAPTSQGEYLMSLGPVNRSLTANYVYGTLFNPATSTKNYVVKRIGLQVNRVGAITGQGYTPATIRYITAASGGTPVQSSTIPKKHTGTATSTADIRLTGVTVTFSQATTSRLLGLSVPGLVNQPGEYDSEVFYGDEFILKPGQGIALYQETAAGDALVRFRLGLEWLESAEPAGSVSCSVSTTTTAFGSLTAASIGTSVPNVSSTMSCSGSALGCTLSVSGLGNGTNAGLASSSAAYVITSHSTILSVGTEGYGIQATTTAAGSGGILGIRGFYNVSSNTIGGLSTSSLTLASSTGAVTSREVVVTHKASISSVTTPIGGGYVDTITYSCVGN